MFFPPPGSHAMQYFRTENLCLWYSLIFLIVVYLVAIVCYRLFLSPLAKFPGPRLAAATGLYETYFQIVKGGVFTWHIDRLHERYGPIVRIKPGELHIKDPDYYSTLYAGPGKHRNKDSWFSNITYPQSLFSTNNHDLHVARRKVLSHFFKKNAVWKLEPVIASKMKSLCRHFSTGAGTQQPLELHAAFNCFTCDTLSEHAFGSQNGFHYLDEPNLSATWKTRINWLFQFCRTARHFPFLGLLGKVSPMTVIFFCPPYKYVYEFEQDVKSRVRIVMEDHRQLEKTEKMPPVPVNHDPATRTRDAIYPAILANPEVPPSEKEIQRLEDDAMFLMMAGTDAPAQALAITVFHILNNPDVHRKVRAELFANIPDRGTIPTLALLEQLPYLNATIREGLRISSIVTTRLPRIAPDEHLQYRQWHIPAGTAVSMSTHFILRDPNIFPEPSKFIPERWLLCPTELQELQKYLIPASKGTLGCLGQNLNWALMQIVLGTLLRRFDLGLHQTTEKNVEMTRDNFIGQTEKNMNLIQVKVLQEYEK
ncbi:benzoate 4-monooxygenase cytochrome P450 [Aspergillus coremiiformis]|uniref:Benzoate 4-monooxygenase cytochrome P450 n=1 Tax=Aspergillus coremiiformis TaxID=138285 RepID=A0A5N6YX37_9EURO|nr:benzoate 4-monooxygenase cytochrome P450 [Aspergillus coremiiformis]